MNRDSKIAEEIFRSIDVITEKRIQETAFSTSLTAKVVERIKFSDMYKLYYQNEEIRAMSLGGTYEPGDEVVVLMPDKRIDHLKFIMGRTNNRTPTIVQSEQGVSDAVLKEIQDALETISDIGSDGVISPVEKSTLAIQWRDLTESYNMLLKESLNYPEVETKELQERYKELESFLEPIFADMGTSSKVSGTELRDMFGSYYKVDQETHQSILEAIADQVGYKVEVMSSNGTQFVNGVVDTVLEATVFRGKKDITKELPPESFQWRRIFATGEEDEDWKKEGRQISITGEDVIGRSTFICEIEIE